MNPGDCAQVNTKTALSWDCFLLLLGSPDIIQYYVIITLLSVCGVLYACVKGKFNTIVPRKTSAKILFLKRDFQLKR